MKKLLSVLLAVLMAFSAVTVAFATDAELDPVPETTTEAAPEEEGAQDAGDLQWILDLPFWTVGPALKFAEIAFKLITVYLKVAKIFGIVDKDMSDYILEAIVALIENSENSENGDVVVEDTTAPVETFALIA